MSGRKFYCVVATVFSFACAIYVFSSISDAHDANAAPPAESSSNVYSPESRRAVRTATPTATPTPTRPPPPACGCGQQARWLGNRWLCECTSGLVPVSRYTGVASSSCMAPLPPNWSSVYGITISTQRQDRAGRALLPVPGLSIWQSGPVCADVLRTSCGLRVAFDPASLTYNSVAEHGGGNYVNIGAMYGSADPRWAYRGYDGGHFNCSRQDAAGGRPLPTINPVAGQTYLGCCDWISPAPPPPACLWSYAAVEQGAGDGNKYEEIFHRTQVPHCLLGFLHNVVRQCAGDGDGSDDCSARYIVPGFRTTGDSVLRVVAFTSDCAVRRIASVQELSANMQCYAGYFRTASPVSLILGPGDENDGKSTISRFPLNPGKLNGFYEWKASSRAPLLVYDPLHKGQITSATQLFGDWTFGGRRIAGLSTALSADSIKWRNGFEALGTLDIDGDDKISGEELAPLALWFDGNRDGISQEGEVRPLGSTGIKALYYAVSRTDDRTGSLYVDRGYEREVDGTIVIGMAVDWFGREANGPEDLIFGEMLDRASSESVGLTESSAGKPAKRAEEISDAPKSNTPSKISGIWKWERTGYEGGGALLLKEKKDGTLTGFSFLGSPATAEFSKLLDAESASLAISIAGGSVQNTGGTVTGKFILKYEGVTTTESTFSLSADGTMLTGRTVTAANPEKGDAGLEYSWTAKRIEKPNQESTLDQLIR